MLLQGFKWGVFFVIACFLIWRSVIVNLSEHYASQQTLSGASNALQWYPNHPRALLQWGIYSVGIKSEEAEALLHQAAAANPAKGYAFMALALRREARGDAEAAEALAFAASRLAPLDSEVQLKVAGFWAGRGELAKAFGYLDNALLIRPRLGKVLFPDLLQLVDTPQGKASLAAFHDKMLRWWPDFFAYAAVNAESVDAVMALYLIRSRSGHEISADERLYYLTRLEREELWREAYDVWLNQLGPTELEALGYLYNGSFELPLTQQGFDWKSYSSPGAIIAISEVDGDTANRALHLVFQGKAKASGSIYQNLFLEPGDYRFQGSVKPDQLQTLHGVRWVLRCLSESREVFHESEHFMGTSQWRTFATRFTVPDQGCGAQRLTLQVAGRFDDEREVRGALWFDDLSLVRL